MLTALTRAQTFGEALSYARGDADFSLVDGLRAPVLAGLLSASGGPRAMLAITPTSREAETLGRALRSWMPGAAVLELPAWETLPHERLSPSAETVGHRLAALRALREWADAPRGPFVLTASVRAALQPLADNLAELEPLSLTVGGRGYDLAQLSARLVDLAYARVDMVTRRGEFAVRGGILDVFSPVAEHPLRLDFFGDELEQVRPFSVADQRSLPAEVSEVVLPPSRELLLSESVRSRARQLQAEFPNLQGMLARIAEGIPVEGMESLAPALVDRLVPITHYLPPDAAIAVISPEKVATRALHLAETNREFLAAAWSAATAGAQAPVDLGGLQTGDFLTVTQLREAAGQRPWWTLSAFDSGRFRDDSAAPNPSTGDMRPLVEGSRSGTGRAGRPPALASQRRPEMAFAPSSSARLETSPAGAADYVRLEATAVPSFAGHADGALEHVGQRLGEGWSVLVAAEGAGLVDRAVDVLGEAGLAGRADSAPEAGVATVTQASVEAGFELPEIKLAVLSEAEFFGRAVGFDTRQPKRLASKRRNVVDPLQLKAGDFVVHQTHGIGRFVELVEREVSTGGRNAVRTTREFLVLEYAPNKRGYPPDKLYVPTDQLDLLSRYVGGEAPALSKMGGSDWAAAKGKARRAVRDIAVELVKLYSARMSAKGHAFAPDTPWQRELEDAFAFAETPDQLTTIDEVKADMERDIPMDRLLSGDVGYGKTEVAVRAAFKAVQGGKQVAMIVPTTLLVKQHTETFTERFAGFPVHLRALSRFQTEKEAKETIEGLADGTVDVVIGTHRLLGQGIRFKDLGLVIIDEEQRFGVEHKDALKKLKTNVDVLAMTATPIPRTLEMAVTGIREMSTLATPPEDRHPILSFVGPYSEQQVAAAIRRELLREGQVVFVHIRVSSITRTAAKLAELVPEARIAVAHGQLSESVLEQVMVDFWERRFDVLVSTTIVETGLDIPNANTLIIDRADKYGLSQLHQLRGRVGRGRERAYAYFLYDPEKPLSETAHERLSTIAANNELGAGMQIALKDLEIRGAGNLLGGEQSGHIAGVGFDLYLRMIGEAVADFRGESTEGPTELRLELPVDARIPEDYIDSERLRLEAYQKLSAASAPAAAPDAIDRVVEELTDRYGEPPEQVAHLVAVSRMRRRAQQAGLSEVVVMGDKLRMAPLTLSDSLQVRLARMFPGSRYLAQASAVLVPLPPGLADAALLDWVESLFTALLPAPAPDADPAPPPASGSAS